MRVIEYTIDDPNRAGYGEMHRLIIMIDKVDTHQRVYSRPLRSKKPVGVIQELYGLLIAHYIVRVLMHEAAL